MGSHIQRNSILIIVVVLLLLVVSGSYLFLRKVVKTTDIPTPFMTETESGEDTSSDSAGSANIMIMSPTSGAAVQLPMIITGQARVFESVVSYRIVDDKGTVLSSGNTMANSPDAGQFGPFTITIKDLGEFTNGNMTIEVYQSSAKDGSEIDKVTVSAMLQ